MKVKPHQLAFAAFAALLVHILLLFTLFRIQPSAKLKPVSQKISVSLEKPNTKKRVVQTEREKTDTPPKQADFLGEFNNQVAKESQSSSSLRGASAPKQSRGHGLLPATPSARGRSDESHRPSPNLIPNWQQLEKLGEDADKPRGSETRLNTFEWKHASYFNRIREAVSRVWAPQLAIKRYDPYGKLLGKLGRITIVEVTLDENGNLVSAEIQTPSGVYYLDEAALSAFQRAGPFPNPPKVLFANKDKFSFSFGFRISMEQGFSLDFD